MSLYELLENSYMQQYFRCRFEWYCKKFGWEKYQPDQIFEFDKLDGPDAIYVLVLYREKVVFGWRILQKEFIGTLPAEKELASEPLFNAVCDHIYPEYEITRFASNEANMKSLSRDKLKYCPDMLFGASYRECKADTFIVFLNIAARAFLRKCMRNSWCEQRIGANRTYRNDICEFAGFLLFNDAKEQ